MIKKEVQVNYAELVGDLVYVYCTVNEPRLFGLLRSGPTEKTYAFQVTVVDERGGRVVGIKTKMLAFDAESGEYLSLDDSFALENLLRVWSAENGFVQRRGNGR